MTIVCTPSFCWGGVGVEPPTKFFLKRGCLTRSPFFEGVVFKEGGDFFIWEVQLLKYEIFNDKKSSLS